MVVPDGTVIQCQIDHERERPIYIATARQWNRSIQLVERFPWDATLATLEDTVSRDETIV